MTLRRPRITAENKVQVRDLVRVESSCSVHMAHCTLNGSVGGQRKLIDNTCKTFGGISVAENGNVSVIDVSISSLYFLLN